MRMFNIGDRVCNSYGQQGTVTDRMYSEAEKVYFYTVNFDNDDSNEGILMGEEQLRLYIDTSEYKVETEILDGVCIGIIYEVKEGKKTEVSRGHGHIIHEGAVGVAQAVSYAFKKAYEKLNGGTIRVFNKEKNYEL